MSAIKPAMFLASLLLLIEPLAAIARSVPLSETLTETYPRVFFEPFNPRSALDMLERVPGFELDAGAEVRGFSGAAGNVLIDGVRSPTKTGLEELLASIPAGAVERIEIRRGGGDSAEMVGQSVIANIVRQTERPSGSWSLEVERAPDGRVYPRGRVAVTRKLGAWETQSRVNAFWERFPFRSFTRLDLGPGDEVVRFQQEQLPSVLTQAFVATEARRQFESGRLTVSARLGFSGFYRDTERLGHAEICDPCPTPDDRLLIDLDSEYVDGEVSLEWTQPVAERWSLTLLGLTSGRSIRESGVTRLERPVGGEPASSGFEADRQPLEALLRAELGGRTRRGLDHDHGLEVAYNRLDSTLAFQSDAVVLPAADVRVEEYRLEPFSSWRWTLWPGLDLTAALAAEASQIRVSGDVRNEQRFYFLKPSAALSHTVNDQVQLSLAMRREVGQLPFEDFAASAQAEEDRLLGGNPDLGPDRITRVSASADWRTSEGAAINATIFHEWRSDVLEQVVLPSGAAGLGNAGSARAWGIEGSLAWPLAAWIPGARIDASFRLEDADFEDPLTGRSRRLNEIERPRIGLRFRQDFQALPVSWGFKVDVRSKTEIFFADEVLISRRGMARDAFIETTALRGLKLRLDAKNLGGRSFPFERRLFAPDRSGDLAGRQLVARERGTFLTLTISGEL